MPGLCSTCDREWSSYKECHCVTCHLQFSTLHNFDLHMDRWYGCIDQAGMCDAGLVIQQRSDGPVYVGEGDRDFSFLNIRRYQD